MENTNAANTNAIIATNTSHIHEKQAGFKARIILKGYSDGIESNLNLKITRFMKVLRNKTKQNKTNKTKQRNLNGQKGWG